MEFSRQEYWSGLLCPSPGNVPDPRIELRSLILLHCRWILYRWATRDGEDNGSPLWYSCLETPVGGGAWWAADHAVTTSQTQLSNFTFASLSCTGEGNGNPLQCSCLEKPRDLTEWGRTESDTTEAT